VISFAASDFPTRGRVRPNYFSQLWVQPLRLGHKLQLLIENSFFWGFGDALGLASMTISAG